MGFRENTVRKVEGTADVDFTRLTENSPVNIFYCDLNFQINYMNPQSVETLRTIEQHLPMPVDRILGSNIDSFHKDPSHQRRILTNPANLPKRAIIEVGPEKLDLLITAIYDENQEYIGCMATWSVVTEKLITENQSAQKSSMMESAPINIMHADLDGNITYLNKSSRDTLHTVEQHLPIKVEQIVGGSYDVFHKNPAHQRKVLANENNLPHRAMISVGPETLDLLVSPTYDAQGTYIGPMVTWEVVTKKLEAELAAAQKSSMVESAPINIMYADLEGIITYVNAKSIETLGTVEQFLPVKVKDIVGGSYDVFHKNPAHQRSLLGNKNNLPYQAMIDVGPEKLDLMVSPTFDNNGDYIGPMVCWEVVTKKLELETSAAQKSSMVESVPINILYATLDGTVAYANKKSVETLKTIEQYLPVKVKDIVGGSYDVFHKNPAYQRGILSDARNLPHEAQIQVGPELLGLVVDATYDNNGEYIGPMVTWEVITEKVKAQAELDRKNALVQNAAVNMMLADTDFNLTFMNPASTQTLKTLQEHLPDRVENLVGQSIDIFHKNPSFQRGIVGNDTRLPHRAEIQVGPEILDLRVSATYDANGNYTGPMVAWEVVTAQKALAQTLTQASTQLAAAAEELASTAGEMSNNAQSSQKMANEALSSTKEVASGVDQVATNSEEMSAAIQEVATNIQETSSMVRSTLTESDQANVLMGQLSVSSQEIGDVIKVINSIAQQTNLLALNATIEAARAGEAGRGFAVVANEVKELANQTAAATGEITGKISAIQGDTDKSVEAIGRINQSITRINEVASTVSTSIEEQNATISEMTRLAGKASLGVKGTLDNVDMVSGNSNATAAAAEELVSSAEGLSSLAQKLNEIVEQINKEDGK